MRHHRLLSDPRFANGLGKSTTMIFALLMILALIWLIRLTMINSRLGQTRTVATTRSAELEKTTRSLRESNVGYRSKKPSAKAAVSELQSAIESAASKRACIVSEITASPDATPYISQYGGGALPGWLQTAVKVTLVGRSPDVLDTLRSLRSSPLLIEVAGLELQRTDVNSRGESTVAATVDIRLIRRQSA